MTEAPGTVQEDPTFLREWMLTRHWLWQYVQRHQYWYQLWRQWVAGGLFTTLCCAILQVEAMSCRRTIYNFVLCYITSGGNELLADYLQLCVVLYYKWRQWVAGGLFTTCVVLYYKWRQWVAGGLFTTLCCAILQVEAMSCWRTIYNFVLCYITSGGNELLADYLQLVLCYITSGGNELLADYLQLCVVLYYKWRQWVAGGLFRTLCCAILQVEAMSCWRTIYNFVLCYITSGGNELLADYLQLCVVLYYKWRQWVAGGLFTTLCCAILQLYKTITFE